MAHELLNLLKSLNRKERFFLVGDALGNPEFILSDNFQARLTEAIRIDIPPDAWVAMDYHLNWLSGALHMYHYIDRARWDQPWSNWRTDGTQRINGNQQDVDLIVGFEEDGVVCLVLIEAKLDSPWTNSAFESKAKRLKPIFEDANGKPRYKDVKPLFVITSEREPRGLNTESCPAWMTDGGKLRWMELNANDARRQLRRVDSSGEQAVLREARVLKAS